jgi:hypothetical protein
LATLIALLSLPHDRYVRWQDMRSESFARLGWIYERVHFDPTPIDIAFIGTSHTLNGIDAAEVAHLIERNANSAATGTDSVNATNLAIPGYGRNLHWLIARELLENRKVGLLVIEVFENETRKAHPLFIYPAEVSDVLDAPLLINLNFFHDIVRLPFRQLSLFFKSLMPEQFGLKSTFDAAHYDGPTVDNTRVVQVGGKQLTRNRDQRIDPQILESVKRSRQAEKNPHMLGQYFDDLEYRFPRYYVSQILDLAERKGVPVKFLYLPGYGQPDQPYDMRLYRGRGEFISVNDILAKRENWADIDHLNMFGAAELSARLGGALAKDGQNVTAGRIVEKSRPQPSGSKQ